MEQFNNYSNQCPMKGNYRKEEDTGETAPKSSGNPEFQDSFGLCHRESLVFSLNCTVNFPAFH